MIKSYVEEFKNKYSFFEDYGFILANDPCNPERLCYKNLYGEIVIWCKDELSLFSPYICYVQINGWKKEIDIIKEYKKYISKITIFKSFEKLVKELFIFYVNRYKEFYGLKILKNNFNSYPKIKEEQVFINHNFNPIKVGKNSIMISKVIVISSILLLAQVISVFFLEYFKTYKAIYIYETVIYSSILFNGLIVSIGCRNYLNVISKLYLILYPICLLILLNYFPRRIDYMFYMFFFLFSIVYCSIYIIRYKIMNKNGMANGLITSIYPCFIYMIKVFELNSNIYFVNLKAKIYLIISPILTLIAIIIYLKFKEDKNDKKEFIGGFFAVLCLTFALTFFIPYFTVQTINYTFDDSYGVISEHEIVDKNIRVSSGKYHANIYELTIIVDGKKERIRVKSYVYYSYDISDSIKLSYHEGFFDISYYEFVDDELKD